ncbi:hypothetical protein B0T24DRAFT_341452 [Lasiosphaeria ovina]|uniref:Uncharacterized protein n=1 Tax=Lasiosphaeria ovina TaxID=92902 RepID=A0AAE0K3I7_9PEZI|nr:hypothetical protein B0T24DRAFT_341452 [Lasiosphaeria ovina]
MHLPCLHLLAASLIPLIASEPLPPSFNPPQPRAGAAAANWTTQAWQTHGNNIDWFGDFTEICLHLSGPGWRSCHNQGWATISGSGILCYNLDEGHDCCDDGSVCDADLGCCSGTCCQTDASQTVCQDGCVSLQGRGCDKTTGSCVVGRNNDAATSGVPTGPTPTSKSTGAAADPTGTTGVAPTGGAGAAGTAGAAGQSDGADEGLSNSDKIALGCGIGIGLPATIAALYMCWRECLRAN